MLVFLDLDKSRPQTNLRILTFSLIAQVVECYRPGVRQKIFATLNMSELIHPKLCEIVGKANYRNRFRIACSNKLHEH